MAFCTIKSASVRGLGVEMIHVEVDVSNGLPMFHMVGYLSAEVKEAGERVRTAIRNSGFACPPRKTVVNLSPVWVRKRGASFDLPIALGVLAAQNNLSTERIEGTMVAGELSLDGKVRSVPGILAMVSEAARAGFRVCMVPVGNREEAALVEEMEVVGVADLREAYAYMTGSTVPQRKNSSGKIPEEGGERDVPDFRDIQGQEAVKRAVEIAVAGGHNLLMVGPPGSGKTMISSRIPGILPPLGRDESIEITKIYSVLGRLDPDHPLITSRPFRQVHHTVTKAALIGGGTVVEPGEISMAHKGVLFLDELAEFKRPVLEVLRQPLEDGEIRLSRKGGYYSFPADFMLVAAMNPCPCGNYPNVETCACTPVEVQSYLSRLSQPFLDRIDICVETVKVDYESLRKKGANEPSEEIQKRVCKARELQRQRFGAETCNAAMGMREIEKYCRLGSGEEQLMKKAYEAMGLTARTFHKILKVARTIADMDREKEISQKHLKEAMGYRMMNKKYWGR